MTALNSQPTGLEPGAPSAPTVPSDRVHGLQARVSSFMAALVYPNEHPYDEQARANLPRPFTPGIVQTLKQAARAEGLWNLFLPGEHGVGLSNLDHAPLAEQGTLRQDIAHSYCEIEQARVIDRAIQIHGGMGVSQDTFLAEADTYARFIRIGDGPDQVHLAQLGRTLLQRFAPAG